MSAIGASDSVWLMTDNPRPMFDLMQLSHSEIKTKLLKAIDNEYNVVDMPGVVEVISSLEATSMTKEALQSTRLGKFINEMRKKTSSEVLAKRAYDLILRWRNLLSKPPKRGGGGDDSNIPAALYTDGSSSSRYAPKCTPTTKPSPISPSLRSNPLTPHVASTLTSPALSGTYPGNLGRSVRSPPISIHSDKSSTSPTLSFEQSSAYKNLLPNQSTPNCNVESNSLRTKTEHMAVVSGLYVTDSVPRSVPFRSAHASNKRLLKDSPTADESTSKVARLSGVASMTAAFAALDISGEGSLDSFTIMKDKSESVLEIPPPVKMSEEEVKIPKKPDRKKGLTKKARTVSINLAKVEDMIRHDSVWKTLRVKTLKELMTGFPTWVFGSQGIDTALMKTPSRLPHSFPIPTGTALDGAKKYELNSELPSVSHLEQPYAASAEAFESSTESQNGKKVVKKMLVFESVSEILGNLPMLPPLDEIQWSSDSECENVKVKRDDIDLDTYFERLHIEHWPNVNGVQGNGRRKDEDDIDGFRMWHESVSKKSYRGELLPILPYVVLD